MKIFFPWIMIAKKQRELSPGFCQKLSRKDKAASNAASSFDSGSFGVTSFGSKETVILPDSLIWPHILPYQMPYPESGRSSFLRSYLSSHFAADKCLVALGIDVYSYTNIARCIIILCMGQKTSESQQ